MAKRIKQVFTNAQCAHVWAQQTQMTGRSGSMFFEGNKIYSYGYHYLAAMIHTVKGKRFALINSHRYSPSTGGHLNDISNAVNSLMPYFHVTNVKDLKATSLELDEKAKQSVKDQLKNVKITSNDSIGWHIDQITDAYKKANDFRALIGKKPIKASKSDLAKVKKHLNARLKRYNELNTPEMRAKKEASKLDKLKKFQEEYEAKNSERIEEFKRGETVYGSIKTPFELLQIRDSFVVTSRGADVPLTDAMKLFHALESEPHSRIVGQTVGSFTVESIDPIENDLVVKIGCHKILMSEAKRVLGGYEEALEKSL